MQVRGKAGVQRLRPYQMSLNRTPGCRRLCVAPCRRPRVVGGVSGCRPTRGLGRVSVGGFDESAVGEQGAGEVGEGLEVFRFAVVAAYQAAVTQEPGQAGFDDPAVPAEALRRLDALAGDPDSDAPTPDLGPQQALVVGLVGVQFRGSVPWPASRAADRGERVEQRHHHLRVGSVRRGDQNAQRCPAAVTQHVDLRAGFTAVDGIRTGQRPPFSARTAMESTTARDQSISPITPS